MMYAVCPEQTADAAFDVHTNARYAMAEYFQHNGDGDAFVDDLNEAAAAKT